MGLPDCRIKGLVSSVAMRENCDISLSHDERYLFIWMRLIAIQIPLQRASIRTEKTTRLFIELEFGIWLLILAINVASLLNYCRLLD